MGLTPLQVKLLDMLEQLEANYLQVCKVPSRQGGYIRVALCYNCPWYREFCASYVRSRPRSIKLKTYIKRENTIKALKRMLAGNFEGNYAERLLEIADSYSKEG